MHVPGPHPSFLNQNGGVRVESQKPILNHTFQVTAQESRGPLLSGLFLQEAAFHPSCLVPVPRKLPEGALALSGEAPLFSFLMPTCMSTGPSVVPGTPMDPACGGSWLPAHSESPEDGGGVGVGVEPG